MGTTVSAGGVVIWSADVETPADVLKTLDRVPELEMVKIDRPFVDEHGFGIFRELRERRKKVFDDGKIIEIPSKIVKDAKVHLRHQPWMLNVMANGLSSGLLEADKDDEIEALKRFADVCLAAGTEPCVVTVLTSKTDDMVKLEYNERSRIDQVLEYLEIALDCGVTNFVCSTAELPAIRAESRFDGMQGNIPGIRLPGSDSHDQASVGTPIGAIQAGANRLVIGRDLTGEDAPEKWARINANLRGE